MLKRIPLCGLVGSLVRWSFATDTGMRMNTWIQSPIKYEYSGCFQLRHSEAGHAPAGDDLSCDTLSGWATATVAEQ
jgi:hypothetical protein